MLFYAAGHNRCHLTVSQGSSSAETINDSCHEHINVFGIFITHIIRLSVILGVLNWQILNRAFTYHKRAQYIRPALAQHTVHTVYVLAAVVNQ